MCSIIFLRDTQIIYWFFIRAKERGEAAKGLSLKRKGKKGLQLTPSMKPSLHRPVLGFHWQIHCKIIRNETICKSIFEIDWEKKAKISFGVIIRSTNFSIRWVFLSMPLRGLDWLGLKTHFVIKMKLKKIGHECYLRLRSKVNCNLSFSSMLCFGFRRSSVDHIAQTPSSHMV